MNMLRLIALVVIVLASNLAVAADRVTADAMLANVPTLLKENNYKTIEDMCSRALQADNTTPNAHYYMGLVHEKNNKPRDAFKCYQSAALNATKEKDASLAAKASAAAKKLGAGLIELDAIDTKLADKLQKLADEAYEAGQLETARSAFSALVVMLPDNATIKERFEKVTVALQERGDPIKAKIAAAMLAETWYKVGIGKKDEAADQARALSAQYANTEYGKEAAAMLARNFAAPDRDEISKLAKKLKDEKKTKKVVVAVAPSTTDSTASTPKVSTPVSSSPPRGGVDVEAVEKAADEATKAMPKDKLVPAFTEAYKTGKASYAKSTPGSEGNQENVANALQHFIKAESIYQRIEDEKLTNADLASQSKEASMLRYGCMKMTILGH